MQNTIQHDTQLDDVVLPEKEFFLDSNELTEDEKLGSVLYFCLYMRSLRTLELLPLVKNFETACLINWLEPEFLFNPDGFFMFNEPHPEKPDYVAGDSLPERQRVSARKLEWNFDQIGIRYKSYEELSRVEDKFKGKYYCSYYDKSREQAYYIRNNELVEESLRSIFNGMTLTEAYAAFRTAMEDAKEQLLAEEAKQTRKSSQDKRESRLKKLFKSSEYFKPLKPIWNLSVLESKSSGTIKRKKA